jgi:hypothetical protein
MRTKNFWKRKKKVVQDIKLINQTPKMFSQLNSKRWKEQKQELFLKSQFFSRQVLFFEPGPRKREKKKVLFVTKKNWKSR